ncbi:MAG: M20/M25/M40 family metallo-hydrolase [Acidimicrobiales bacterium]
MSDDAKGEVTELLQSLIRNACVNDGTLSSGQEVRTSDVLAGVLSGPGLDLQTYEAAPGRTSLVARIEGSDPSAPTLLLMGHTDVVPVNPAGWQRDPHGGELEDGVVWGRGAVDMLNLTSSMAVATRRLARSNFRPRGTLVFLAVADEEAGGTLGAGWLADHAPEAIKADFVVTESGGIPTTTPVGPRLNLTLAEKGTAWCRLTVKGTPGHGSRPLRSDNALIKAAAVVERLSRYRPPTTIGDIWRLHVEGMSLDPVLADPDRVWDACQDMDDLRLARLAHACTHTTFSPNVVSGGTKTNIIPDQVSVEVDIRTLPGQGQAEVQALLEEALGPLMADVEIEFTHVVPATASPVGTPLQASLARVVADLHPGAELVPTMTTGGTDARYFREMGTVAYGFGLFSPAMTLEAYSSMFHGNDERVDVESLGLSEALWEAVVRDFLTDPAPLPA